MSSSTATARARDLLGIGTLTNAALTTWLHGLPGVDQVGAEARAAALATRSIKTTAKAWAIDTAISMIDLTTLEGADTEDKVRSLCAKARIPDPRDPTTPQVAAVCVYNDLAHVAVDALKGTDIHVAAVATAFPSGRATLPVKLADTADAVRAGAHEIDMVIDRGAFLSGRYLDVFEEIAAVKEACGADGADAHLKVILETGELVTYDNVRRASWLAMLAGGGLHQDLHGQDVARGDAAGHHDHARGRARLARGHRLHGRRQAGRRHPEHQGRAEAPGGRQRDRG